MFNQAIRGQRAMLWPLSSDHDPLYRFAQRQANLRILDVAEIKTVPCVPLSHPFVERLIGYCQLAENLSKFRGQTSLHWKQESIT